VPQFMSITDPEFESRFTAFLEAKREDCPDVAAEVATIIAEVRKRGDAALIDLTKRLDRMALTPETIAFRESEIDAECDRVPAAERAALETAARRIREYHQRQVPDDASWTDSEGATLGWRWSPVGSAGLYVPGGLASYPSSVLMNAIPANVAGVDRVSVTVPTPDGETNPLVFLAARLAGVDTIYRLGGAQAIAALAYGTESVQHVDKITGPGNAYVAAAKRQVFGKVGIDMIAGPSEILVIADRHNDPEWIAIDLLSQAEHDANAQSILITDDEAFGDRVVASTESGLARLERHEIARASWRDYGAVIIVETLEQGVYLSNRLAPEHLQLCVRDPDVLARGVRNAGAVFVGSLTPEAIGDYVGGPNHVLPTARSARFSSGLGVLDFLKRTTFTRMTPEALATIGPAAEILAASESLQAHGLSIRVRLDRLKRTASR